MLRMSTVRGAVGVVLTSLCLAACSAGPSPSSAPEDEAAVAFVTRLELAWSSMSQADQDSWCSGIDLIGMEAALDEVEAGWNDTANGDPFDRAAAARYYENVCR